MIDNELINFLANKYAKCTSNEDKFREQTAFVVAQSIFCWLFRNYHINFKTE